MAELESSRPIGRGRTHHDGVEQPAPAHGHHRLAAQRLEPRAQPLAHHARVLGETLVAQHLERGDRHRRSERVAPVRRAVLAWRYREHHLVARQDGAHRVHAAGERLAQHEHVGPHLLVVDGKHRARAPQASLHLVRDHEHVVPRAQRAYTREVALVRHDDACLALYGLEHEGGHVRVRLERGLERGQVVVRHQAHARREGAEALAARRVGARGARGDRAPPEVILAEEHRRLVLGDALDVVAPPPGELDGGLPALDASVHRQHALVAEEARDEALVLAEHAVVEGARGERELGCLVAQRRKDLGVRVALVDRGVRREEVKVPLALHVPHMHALAPLEHHRQRVVVVRSVPLLECDEPLGFAAGWLRRRLEAERAPCRYGRESAGRADAKPSGA
mmetsp:Transcript_36607/g.92793  ORF Transcript_36607/g.92793 Transcript_36607/m.92793 type:complete len:394 (-) Transcript_36607:31-1212(-)